MGGLISDFEAIRTESSDTQVELLHTGLEDGVEFSVVLENVRSDHKERQPALGHHTSQIVHVVADADEKRHLQDIHAY